jgi:Peptidase family M48
MRLVNLSVAALVFAALPFTAPAQQPSLQSELEDKIASREWDEMRFIRQYSPLIETYIQTMRQDKRLGELPDGDKYFLGRADFSRGVDVVSLNGARNNKKKFFGAMGAMSSMDYSPDGFLQMVFLDTDGLNRSNYKFTFVRREFLGDVRCLVFDLAPLPKSGKGRFVGRIWVEDQDDYIVRFNGSYGPASLTSNYFSFDSWRVNVGKNRWLPAFIYTQQGDFQDRLTQSLAFKPFRAQTRLWGYAPGGSSPEQVLTKLMIDGPLTVRDQSSTDDYSPISAERFWARQAEDNIIDSLERQGLMAPYGEVDKVLETVVNNIAVTNDLDLQPEVRCRVLMTSTLESFAVGHTIVLSRGLIDVLPDEASLATILAHELAHVLLGHQLDTQFGFVNHLRFDEKQTFRHFSFAGTPDEERAANQKGAELLAKSPYKEQTESARLFFQALASRSKGIPNLISPHLGDRVSTGSTLVSQTSAASPQSSQSAGTSSQSGSAVSPSPASNPAASAIAALPLGGRIKIDPWSAQLQLLKSKSVGNVSDYERMPFAITPFFLFLSRQADSPVEAPGTPSAANTGASSATNPTATASTNAAATISAQSDPTAKP